MSALCYLNGNILPTRDAALGIQDLALQRGYGVFDYARTYRHKLFHFEEHLLRLQDSASALHLKLPLSTKEITSIAEQLVQDSGLNDPAIRLLLTGGYASSPAFQDPNFIIIAEEIVKYPASIYNAGVALALVNYQRELPEVKSINYLNAFRLEPFRNKKNVFDLLYYAQHGITECPRANIFFFLGDTLVTPSSHILKGITREIILKLAADLFPIEIREIFPQDLHLVDEVFITATSKAVVPVIRIDGKPIGSGTVGQHTKKIMHLYEEYTAAY